MHILQISFSHEYIYSPTTWLHKVKSFYKICFLFVYLSFIPYYNSLYIFISIINCLFIVWTLKLPKEYYKSFLNILIIIVTCLLSNYNFKQLKHNIIKINIPFKIRSLCLILKKTSNIHQNNYSIFEIPEFLLRIIFISIHYILALKILILTTMYEDIILSLLCSLSINKKQSRLKDIILISCFACQFLQKTMQQIYFITISIKLRNFSVLTVQKKYFVYYYLLTKFISGIKYDIYKLSSLLYIKDITSINFRIKQL